MKHTDKNKKILIIHDHEVIREGLRHLIENRSSFAVIGGESIGPAAIEKVSTEKPDIILLDADMSGDGCGELLSEISRVSPDSRVFVLIANREPELHREVIRNGAAGLFHKEQGCDVFFKALQKVAKGELWIDRHLVSSVFSEMRRRGLDDAEMMKVSSLTYREREIIMLVCEGLRNRQIAERLFIGEKTVRNHLVSIFSKLSVSHRLELSVYARKNGIVPKAH